jgi:predicted hotdog family 3-hydroxylacyl-ACP dehydratase
MTAAPPPGVPSSPCSIEDVIPHRAPMSLLGGVEHFAASAVVCWATIGDDSPFLREGRVHAVVALEYMAQAAAVWTGLTLVSEGKAPRSGFLVSVPSMTLHVEHLAVGDRLTVHAAKVYRGSDSGSFTCSVERRGEVVAQATLTALAPAEEG